MLDQGSLFMYILPNTTVYILYFLKLNYLNYETYIERRDTELYIYKLNSIYPLESNSIKSSM